MGRPSRRRAIGCAVRGLRSGDFIVLNRIQLLGRLERDPEIRRLGEKSEAILAVVTEETIWTEEGRASRKVVHTVVVRRESTVKAVSFHLKAGSRVMVDGTLRYEPLEFGAGLGPAATIFVEAAAHRVTFLDALVGEDLSVGAGCGAA